MDNNVFSIWVVCENPSDYPGLFTARRHQIYPKIDRPSEDLLTARTLEEIRRKLPPGLTRIDRHPSDPPVAVESWV